MRIPTKQFYDLFSVVYPLVDYVLQPQKSYLISELNTLPSGSLLEIGVGNGKHLNAYTKHRVVGIDTSPVMLRKSRENCQKHITLLEMNAEELLFAAHSFDYIVLSHLLSVVNNPQKVLEESHRVLKSNGKLFILNHFTPNNGLQYIDKAFNDLSHFFHFKSSFYETDLHGLQMFEKLKEVSMNRFEYFKLLILRKP